MSVLRTGTSYMGSDVPKLMTADKRNAILKAAYDKARESFTVSASIRMAAKALRDAEPGLTIGTSEKLATSYYLTGDTK